MGSYFKKTKKDIGISLLADPQYTRAWPGGCGKYKVGSNYGPTVYVQKEAIGKGLQQVLWLYGDDNELTEAGTMNVFIFILNDDGGKWLLHIYFTAFNYYIYILSRNIFNFYCFIILEKELITPPLTSGLILPGITRNSILALSKKWNQFKVSERKICMDEVCQLLSENRVRFFLNIFRLKFDQILKKITISF